MADLASGAAYGKIILMGEHAVVHQQPAIAVPFQSVGVESIIESKEGPITIDSQYFTGRLSEAPGDLENIRVVVQSTLEKLQRPLRNIHIQIHSSIPEERGMGSSAAVSTAIVRALYQFYKTPLTVDTLLGLVDQAEKIAHGNPSGLDARVTATGSPVYFIKGQLAENFDIRLSSYLVVADSGLKGQTRQAVEGVAQLLQEAPDRTIEIIKEIGQLVNQAKEAILSDSTRLLGLLMNRNQELLQELKVSSDTLDEYIQVAREAGALGAKLTGGGRGGCLIALAETSSQASHIQQALEKAGCEQTWSFLLETGENKHAQFI